MQLLEVQKHVHTKTPDPDEKVRKFSVFTTFGNISAVFIAGSALSVHAVLISFWACLPGVEHYHTLFASMSLRGRTTKQARRRCITAVQNYEVASQPPNR
jgi:hypothetical protein